MRLINSTRQGTNRYPFSPLELSTEANRVGIKKVFDRIKGKSDSTSDSATNEKKGEAAARRNTNEETVQVKVGDPTPGANSQQQDPTVVATPLHRPMPKARPSPAAPEANRQEVDATVVIPAAESAGGPGPSVAPERPMPRAQANTQADQAEATVVAPPASAPVPQKPAASPFASAQSSPSITPVAQKSPAAEPSNPSPPSPTPASPTSEPNSVSSSDATLYVTPDAGTDHEVAGVLVGLFGEAKGQVFAVPSGQSTLGRAETCEIHVLDAKISREHAAISCVDGNVEIRALNERNPIIVNDGDHAEVQSATDGDKIQFGNAGASLFRFRTIDGL
jgi:hypothetical protein